MLSSDSEASPGNSPSRAGDADEEEDSLANTRKKDGLQSKGKKTKVSVRKVPAKRDGKTNEKAPILVSDLEYSRLPVTCNYCFMVKQT